MRRLKHHVVVQMHASFADLIDNLNKSEKKSACQDEYIHANLRLLLGNYMVVIQTLYANVTLLIPCDITDPQQITFHIIWLVINDI